MPIVRVQMWSGRSEECKVNLAKAITDVVVEELGCPLQAVTVVIEESPKENWVIGGQPCSGSPAGKKQISAGEELPSCWKC